MIANTNTTSKSLPVCNSCSISPLGDVDILVHIVSFVGRGQHRFVASINHRFKNAYQLYHEIYPLQHGDYFYPNFRDYNDDDDDYDSIVWKVTFLNASTVEHAKICFEETNQRYRQIGYEKLKYEEGLCRSAAQYGNLAALKYLLSKNCKWNIWTHWYAGQNRHFELQQWAESHHCPSREECAFDSQWVNAICHGAVLRGYLSALKWTRAKGYDWYHSEYETCSSAAYLGHLNILQWAHANGCEWDENTCINAVHGGHLNVLKWAQSNGCPWNKEKLLLAARRSKRTKIIQWVEREGN